MHAQDSYPVLFFIRKFSHAILKDGFSSPSLPAFAARQISSCVARGSSVVRKRQHEAGHVLVVDKPRELLRSEGVVQMVAGAVDVARRNTLFCTGTTPFVKTRNHVSLET
jgi:hypothetical protein